MLSESQNHRCCYCQRTVWIDEKEGIKNRGLKASIEHVIPKAYFKQEGYTGVLAGVMQSALPNLVVACTQCNSKRDSAVSAHDYYMHIAFKQKLEYEKSKPIQISGNDIFILKEIEEILKNHIQTYGHEFLLKKSVCE